jgi:RNA polymerase sigma-70 factor (ECF subfamily)
VSACVKGDQRAWIELLHRYKRLIYSVTVRFCFDYEDRHDIFQAVCVEVLKNLPSLRKCLEFALLDSHHHRPAMYVLRKRLQQEGVAPAAESEILTADPHSNVLEIYLADRRAALLRDAMDELPEPCRSLLNLLFLSEEKTPYTQLGAMFGWSKDTNRKCRLRCLERSAQATSAKGI